MIRLQEIPETGMGYQNVYLYLKGPYPEKQIFRINFLVLNGTIGVWPVILGRPTEYEVMRIEEITRNNSHIKPD